MAHGLGRRCNVDIALELDFADGRYRFDLTPLSIIELQEKTGKGIIQLCADVQAGIYTQSDGELVPLLEEGRAGWLDIRETIRLAMIGGNAGFVDGKEIEVGPMKASALCASYVDTRPLIETWALAAGILAARILGHEPKKKADPVKEEAEA